MPVAIQRQLARRSKQILTVVAVIALLLVSAVPAGATIVERDRYEDSFIDSINLCGLKVDVEGMVSGHVRIREGKGDNDSAFFLRETYFSNETLTNAETGDSLTIKRRGVFNEVRATRVEGSVFEFTAIEAGQPFVVYDSAGDVVFRDRGVVQTTVLFDTGGDDVPGGEVLDLDFDLRGPHPGFSADFCGDIVIPLIGS